MENKNNYLKKRCTEVEVERYEDIVFTWACLSRGNDATKDQVIKKTIKHFIFLDK